MFILSNAALLSLLALAIAPIAAAPKPSSETIHANFDDLTFNNPVPALNTIPRPYKRLCFDNYVPSDNSDSTFVTPASSPNTAGNDVTTRLTQGLPGLSTKTCSTKVKSFDLQSVFVGCAVVAANSIASVPATCNYRVTGTTTSGKTVTTNYKYTPDSLLKPPMEKIVFPNTFKNLVSVSFSLPNLVENLANVIIIDSYTYKVHY